MSDYLDKLRQQAAESQNQRKKSRQESASGEKDQSSDVSEKVAKLLGVTTEMVDNCCGSICPHCDMFLDKAVSLVELGYPHHLLMNPTQEAMFEEAREIYLRDRKEYETRKTELMDRMR